MLFALLGRKIKLGRDVDLQQFIPSRISQHPDHSVIAFDEAAGRGAEEKPFLDVVKQFAVTPLGLAAVGDVFQDMNGLRTFVRDPRDARSRNQIGAIEHGMHEFVRVFGHGAAERTRIGCNIAGEGHQSSHVDADQLRRWHSDHGGQRAIDAQHAIDFIVYDNEIGNGVKNLQPVTVRLLDTGEQARILQRHSGVTGHGFQENAILLRQRT